jgi:peroxiredoxin Q/BCP
MRYPKTALVRTGDHDRSSVLGRGDLAPDFSLTDSDGNAIKVSDFKDKKKLVIYFYPKDFTPGCITEASEFTRDYEMFSQANIEIIGISPDNIQSHLGFKEKMGIPFLLASDPTNEISKRYGVYGLKNFMGKEYFGVTRSTFLVGKDGKIFKIFNKVKPRGHSQEVLESFE